MQQQCMSKTRMYEPITEILLLHMEKHKISRINETLKFCVWLNNGRNHFYDGLTTSVPIMSGSFNEFEQIFGRAIVANR